jgi:hypothetical protein
VKRYLRSTPTQTRAVKLAIDRIAEQKSFDATLPEDMAALTNLLELYPYEDILEQPLPLPFRNDKFNPKPLKMRTNNCFLLTINLYLQKVFFPTMNHLLKEINKEYHIKTTQAAKQYFLVMHHANASLHTLIISHHFLSEPQRIFWRHVTSTDGDCITAIIENLTLLML